MSHSTSFPIGYCNYSNVVRNGDLYSIDLYYGDLSFDTDFVASVITNWGNDSILDVVDTNGVSIWFDDDNRLNAEDLDGCGFDWSLDDFKTYTSI